MNITDTTRRNEVLARFNDMMSSKEWNGPFDLHEVLADRIVELEATVERQGRSIAALREPSEAVELAATHEYWATLKVSPPIPRALRAAVAAAEQEVDRA